MMWNETGEIHNVQLDIKRPRVVVKLKSTKPSTGSRIIFIKAISEERTIYISKERNFQDTSVTHPDVCLRYTHRPVVPPLPCGLLYQKLGHPLLSGRSNQTSCPQSSSDGMWASPYCTQSLFLWYNSAQSENHISIV